MNNGIVIVAHAPLASALRQCVAHVFPERVGEVLALDVTAQDTPADCAQRAQQALAAWAGRPLLLLTDILGATPCNVARELAQQRTACVLAGVNLPMLLRAVTYQHESLPALAERAQAGGTQGVVLVLPPPPP
jgi:PTS system ascorbate-specific IIA component